MSQSLFTRLSNLFEDRHERMTRRQALTELAVAGAVLALPGCATTHRDRRRKSGREADRGAAKRVAIIGAGLGGLVAADRLSEANCEVVVLEARNRVGGRTLTLRNLGGKYAEAGGEWIGLNHPGWRRLAATYGLELVEATDEYGTEPIVLNGRRLSASEAAALYEEMGAHLADLSERSKQIRDAFMPWNAYDAETLDQTTVDDWLASRSTSEICHAALRSQLENDNGAALRRMSLLGLLAQVAGGGGEAYWTDSEVFRCRGGNQRLAEALAERLGPQRIRLGAAVTNVQLGEQQCIVQSAAGAIEADTVVLATPPSTWHTLGVKYSDGNDVALPGVQMGNAFKYLSAVNTPWWRDAGLSPNGFGDQLIGYTWNAGDGQVADGPELLCAFGGGPNADRLPKDNDQCRTFLRSAVEALLPGFENARVKSADAERLLIWRDDPWTRAGYSCPAPGQVTTLGPKFAAGITIGERQALVFAGEHCCPAFVGYMEGAIQSGFAASSRVSGHAFSTSKALRARSKIA